MEQTAGRLVIYIDPRYDVPRLLTVRGRVSSGYLGDLYRRKIRLPRSVGKGTGTGGAKRYPASSYGLVLWSHGLGWVPPEYSFRGICDAVA